MAERIPQHFIDTLIESTNIVETIGEFVTLKKNGRNYTGLCPFHNEKTPSFSVNSEKQFYYCFGCGAGGNVIQFLTDFNRNDFPETIEFLAKKQGIAMPNKVTLDHKQIAKQSAQRNEKESIYILLNDISKYFHEQLNHPSSTAAQNYLKNRMINTHSINHFNIGYAPNSWDHLLKTFGTTEQQKQLLNKAGMLVTNDNGKTYDRFRNRIMFPILDIKGRTIGFGGRTLGDDKAKYINSPETIVFQKNKELYGLYQSRKSPSSSDEVIICEGYLDVISLHQHSLTHCVATLGTASNSQHFKTLFRYYSDIIFSFDGDKAGQHAAHRALLSLLETLEDGFDAKFLYLPDNEDPDNYIHKNGLHQFKALINQSASLTETLFKYAVNKPKGGLSLGEQAKLSKIALPLISKIPGKAYKQLLLQKLQEYTHLDERTLNELNTPSDSIQNKVEQKTQSSSYTKSIPRHQHQLSIEKRLLSLILNTPEIMSNIQVPQLPQKSQDQLMLLEIITYISKTSHISSQKLLGFCLNHPQKNILLALLGQGHQKDLTIEQSTQEAIDCFQHLKHQQEKLQNKKLVASISHNNISSVDHMDPETKAQFLALFKKK
jgi:DNA primase